MIQTPFIIVIFGATGDLARNKLLPSLFSLFKQNMLPKQFFIIGFSRRDLSDDAYRDAICKDMVIDKKDCKEFLEHVSYQQGFFDEEAGYKALIERLNALDATFKASLMRIFYLATPPDNYENILNFLENTGLSEGRKRESGRWTRIAIEKPFGKDLITAQHLDEKLASIFDEEQIFRVDHYLGKETVQNMLAFRFANSIFEPVWHRNYIDHVQITWAETKGIGTRGKFFEGVGMLRDVAQNHLMQLIATVVMEQPRSFSREAVRDARAQAIKSLRCFNEDVISSVVRGQYKSYLQEKDVHENSKTETFVAMKLAVDTGRFSDVPFFIRAGKRLRNNAVQISLVFKQTNHRLFKEFGSRERPNILTIYIQPNEGINLRLLIKKPGNELAFSTVTMKFTYETEFGNSKFDAYEKILLDIFSGDQMLFNRSDELSSSWEFITTILEGWGKENKKKRFNIPFYEDGSSGPIEAVELIEKDGRKWIE